MSKHQKRMLAFLDRNGTDGVFVKRLVGRAAAWLWRSDCYANAALCKRACKRLHLKT